MNPLKLILSMFLGSERYHIKCSMPKEEKTIISHYIIYKTTTEWGTAAE